MSWKLLEKLCMQTLESGIALVIPGTCAADTWKLLMLQIMNEAHNKYMTGGDLLVPAEMVTTTG